MQAPAVQSSNHRFARRGHVFAMLEKVRSICAHPFVSQGRSGSSLAQTCRGAEAGPKWEEGKGERREERGERREEM